MLEEVSSPRPPAAHAIRDARHEDLPAICDIYNHYVLHSTVTFDEDPTTPVQWETRLEELRRLGMPMLVLEGPRSEVLGYALVAPWRHKAAYRYTVENSIYLHRDAAGKGYGAALLAELLARSQSAGLRQIIAVIRRRGRRRLDRAALPLRFCRDRPDAARRLQVRPMAGHRAPAEVAGLTASLSPRPPSRPDGP